GRGHGLIHIGTCSERLEFGFETALLHKLGLVHDDVDRVLTRERALPTKTERPPAFLFQPVNGFVGNFFIGLRPTPIRKTLCQRWNRCEKESGEGRTGYRVQSRNCLLVHFTPPHFCCEANILLTFQLSMPTSPARPAR